MTSSGEPPRGAGGVDESDWIDRILERATERVAEQPAAMPIVPEPGSEGLQGSTERPAAQTTDGLAEIKWVDSPQVTPASTPIAAPTGLVPQAVGRSAYSDDLRSIGPNSIDTREPEGWEKLSWQDLDDKHPPHVDTLREETGFGRMLREWGPVLFAAVAIALFTRLVLVQAYHIPSGSMVPTLEEGDRVVVNRLSYRFGEIERGQVVVFEKPPGQEGENDLIKRVIGLPGETIRFDSNNVYIDGFRVEEPYLAESESTRPRLTIPGCAQLDAASDLCAIPEGHVFVMGDNRKGSQDSRVFGPVPVDSIVGRAFLRVWPLNNIGEL